MYSTKSYVQQSLIKTAGESCVQQKIRILSIIVNMLTFIFFLIATTGVSHAGDRLGPNMYSDFSIFTRCDYIHFPKYQMSSYYTESKVFDSTVHSLWNACVYFSLIISIYLFSTIFKSVRLFLGYKLPCIDGLFGLIQLFLLWGFLSCAFQNYLQFISCTNLSSGFNVLLLSIVLNSLSAIGLGYFAGFQLWSLHFNSLVTESLSYPLRNIDSSSINYPKYFNR
ncbi:hypothetical protein GJ496_010415 [Pomphorhynchus laevis]|nr:hypothetical protein GJ496_010415 [Pomphorhynchus laevis]